MAVIAKGAKSLQSGPVAAGAVTICFFAGEFNFPLRPIGHGFMEAAPWMILQVNKAGKAFIQCGKPRDI